MSQLPTVGNYNGNHFITLTTGPLIIQIFCFFMKVYRKYQVVIHKDAPEKCSPHQFTRFLCDSSLILRQQPFVDPVTESSVVPGYGAFHQQYLIDGKIVCVGVFDILPTWVILLLSRFSLKLCTFFLLYPYVDGILTTFSTIFAVLACH